MNTTTAPGSAVDPRQFKSFAQFYPFYLTEHANLTCRRLHFAGLDHFAAVPGGAGGHAQPAVAAGRTGGGLRLAWVGHFGFEKNKPASFKRPLYSFMGDWAMYRDIWLGRVKI